MFSTTGVEKEPASRKPDIDTFNLDPRWRGPSTPEPWTKRDRQYVPGTIIYMDEVECFFFFFLPTISSNTALNLDKSRWPRKIWRPRPPKLVALEAHHRQGGPICPIQAPTGGVRVPQGSRGVDDGGLGPPDPPHRRTPVLHAWKHWWLF